MRFSLCIQHCKALTRRLSEASLRFQLSVPKQFSVTRSTCRSVVVSPHPCQNTFQSTYLRARVSWYPSTIQTICQRIFIRRRPHTYTQQQYCASYTSTCAPTLQRSHIHMFLLAHKSALSESAQKRQSTTKPSHLPIASPTRCHNSASMRFWGTVVQWSRLCVMTHHFAI